jgi:branched-chain amino acid transport system substrate-binding protein
MTACKYPRRASAIAAIAIVAGLAGMANLQAQQKTIKIGLTLPLTGADAEDAYLIKSGTMMAIDEANAKGGVAGYHGRRQRRPGDER